MAALLSDSFPLNPTFSQAYTRAVRFLGYELDFSFEWMIPYILPFILLILIVAAELFAGLLQNKLNRPEAAKRLKTVCSILRIPIGISILYVLFIR